MQQHRDVLGGTRWLGGVCSMAGSSPPKLMRAQGVPPSSVEMNVSPQQMGALLGNAFTKPVIGRAIDHATAAWPSGLDAEVT